ncbi:MAG TPA: hypothetical protein PK546_05615 [Chitinophagales bacterium]|jgi:hypothetical protein|nr:hypothetical protein [Chitinophagales bacterium]HPH86906.1 hypothetical protein [Chitinophagales bacterium]HPN18999.1 hypothetical protein [Chitinophagales bacterium]
MKTLNVPINDVDFASLGLANNTISFDELKEKMSVEYAKEALQKCNDIALEVGLSKMTLEEINEEIAAVRNAKNNH